MKNLSSVDENKDIATKEYVDTGLSGKQATLVSGTNIKTINNQSILGSGNISISGGGGGGGQPDLIAIDGSAFNLWDLDTGMYVLLPESDTITMSYYSDGSGTVSTLALPDSTTITVEKCSGSTESEGITLSADVITFIIYAYETGVYTGNQMEYTFSAGGQSQTLQSGSMKNINASGGLEVNTFEDLPSSNVPEYTKAYVKHSSLYDTTSTSDLGYDVSLFTDLSFKEEEDMDFSQLTSSSSFTIILEDYLGTNFGFGLIPTSGQFLVMMGYSNAMTVGYDYLPPIYIYLTGETSGFSDVPVGWSMYVNGANVFIPITFDDIPLLPVHLMEVVSSTGDPTLGDYLFVDAKKHWAGEYRYINGEWVYQGTAITQFIDSKINNVPSSRLVEYICAVNKKSITQMASVIEYILEQIGGQ